MEYRRIREKSHGKISQKLFLKIKKNEKNNYVLSLYSPLLRQFPLLRTD